MIIAIITTVDAPAMFRKRARDATGFELHARDIRHAVVNPLVSTLRTVVSPCCNRVARSRRDCDRKYTRNFPFLIDSS